MTETAYEFCPDCGQPIWQLTRIGGGIVPDTDTRCAHHDAAGQCLDHQGHPGGHQPPAQDWGIDLTEQESTDFLTALDELRHQPPAPPLSVSEG